MSTASFDKEFVVTDPKAIEKLLYDLEHAPKRSNTSKTATIESILLKRKILALAKNNTKKSA